MTNINIEIPEEIHKQVKLQAVLQDKTIKDYIIQTLEDKFSNNKQI